MQVSRRMFCGNLAWMLGGTVAAAQGVPAANAISSAGKPRLKFGVITDMHIGTPWEMGINSPGTEKALRMFREMDVDAVVMPGDMIDTGSIAQLRELARIWYEVFPDGKGKDGRNVEKIMVTGNHDVACWTPPEKQSPEKQIVQRIAELWEEVLHEHYEPVFRKEVNGIQFVCANWGIYPKKEMADAYRKEDVEPVLREALRLAKPGDPVFYVQHAPLPKTCFGSNSQAYGTAATLFGKDEQVFALTGHSHKPLTHPRSIWQDGFTALHTGVVAWTDFGPFCWPNNLPASAVYAKYAVIISVYDNRIVIDRKNVCFDSSLGETWTVPLPLRKETFPYTAEKLRAKAEAPRFPTGARVAVNIGMGENVFWTVPPNKNAIQGKGGIVVSFPAACVTGGDNQVMYYEVTVTEAASGKAVTTKKCYTEFYLDRDHARNTYEYLIDAEKDKLPEGVPCVYTVRPVDFFETKGSAIVSAPIAFRRFL